MFFEIVTSSAGIIQPWIRGCRRANSGREITAVNCITNHEGLSVFHFSICQQFFFSYLHLQSSWLLIKRTLTHLHRLNRKTCTTFFFFFLSYLLLKFVTDLSTDKGNGFLLPMFFCGPLPIYNSYYC